MKKKTDEDRYGWLQSQQTRVVSNKKEAKNSCFTALCAMSFSPLLIRTCAGYQVGEVIGSGTMAESVSFPAFLVPFFFVSICCLHSLFFHFQHFLFLSVSSACLRKGFDQLDPTKIKQLQSKLLIIHDFVQTQPPRWKKRYEECF